MEGLMRVAELGGPRCLLGWAYESLKPPCRMSVRSVADESSLGAPEAEGILPQSSDNLRAVRFEGNSHFFSAREGTTDIPVLGTGIERDQSIAMLAVRLKAIANLLRPLSKHHRTFGASDFDLIINHG
jgi:hypothetical protein